MDFESSFLTGGKFGPGVVLKTRADFEPLEGLFGLVEALRLGCKVLPASSVQTPKFAPSRPNLLPLHVCLTLPLAAIGD